VINALDAAIAAGQQRQKAAAKGQMGLFDLGGEVQVASKPRLVVDEKAIEKRQLLTWEKELTGMYLSEHPLKQLRENGETTGISEIIDLAERPAGDKVRVIGMVNSVRRIITKKNRTMAIIDLEDLTGTIELVAFPDCYEQFAELWEPDEILDITAKVDRRNEQLQLICETATNEIKQMVKPIARRQLQLRLPMTDNYDHDVKLMTDVFSILREYEGDDDVVITIPTRQGQVALKSRTHRVEFNERLRDALVRVVDPRFIELVEPALAS
jgi:DNA polymerase-3 subunit alpha